MAKSKIHEHLKGTIKNDVNNYTRQNGSVGLARQNDLIVLV
jgi:hypothetical protein